MKPYSVDLREKVIQAYEKRTHSFRQLAAMFSVSLNFVWLLVSQHKKTGSVAPKPHRQVPSDDRRQESITMRLLERHDLQADQNHIVFRLDPGDSAQRGQAQFVDLQLDRHIDPDTRMLNRQTHTQTFQ